MDEELDLVVFVDDDGGEKTMEVLDYFYYEGEQYGVLAEASECEEDHEHCDGCHEHKVDAFIMKIVPVGEDEEEFVSVEDEALMDKLIEFVENELYSDDDDEEEDEEEGEEEDDE